MQEFNDEGVYQGQFANAGTSEERVSYPSGITVDSEGNVWVLDSLLTPGGRMVEYSPSGQYVRRFLSTGSGEGRFCGPWPDVLARTSTSPTSATSGCWSSQPRAHTSDSSTQGARAAANPPPRGASAQTRVRATSTSPTSATAGIQEFSPEGGFIAVFGSFGSGNGEFDGPSGLHGQLLRRCLRGGHGGRR